MKNKGKKMERESGNCTPTPVACAPFLSRRSFNHTTTEKSTTKAMKKNIYRIARYIAAPFRMVGLLVCLLVAYTEGEHEPHE